jgi:NitT/TauT family transport system substrate-binding protein
MDRPALRTRALAGALVAALTLGCAQSRPELVELRVGDHGIVGEAPTYIAIEAGYFADEGLEIELQPFRSAVDMVPLLGQNRVDAGAGAVSAALFNAVADGVDVRIVADSAKVASGAADHLALVVRAGLADAVQDVADLRGHVVAINAPGGGLEVQLDAALAAAALGPDDIVVRHLAFPEMTAALANGSVDAAIVPEPFLTLGLDAGTFVALASIGAVLPGHQISVLLFSPGLAAREDVAERYLRAYLRGVADYRAALVDRTVDPTAVIDAIMAHAPIDDRTLFDRMAYHDIDADGTVDVDSLARDLEFYRHAGYVTEPIDLERLIDTSFLDAVHGTPR